MFEEVDKRKAMLDALGPLNAETAAKLERALDPLFVYDYQRPSSEWAEMKSLPLEPSGVQLEELGRFLTSELGRFVARVEALITPAAD